MVTKKLTGYVLCIHENVEIFSPRYTNSIYLILHCRQECYFEDILTLSLTGIARAWLLRGGGADSAPAYNSMNEGTETQHYYSEFGPLSKWRSMQKSGSQFKNLS